MSIETAQWVVAIASVVAIGGLIYWLVNMFSRGRMMRCPESGSITFVRVASAAGGHGTSSKVAVTQCDSWPERKDCAQGCLARYSETTVGYRVNLESLRPFEPR